MGVILKALDNKVSGNRITALIALLFLGTGETQTRHETVAMENWWARVFFVRDFWDFNLQHSNFFRCAFSRLVRVWPKLIYLSPYLTLSFIAIDSKLTPMSVGGFVALKRMDRLSSFTWNELVFHKLLFSLTCSARLFVSYFACVSSNLAKFNDTHFQWSHLLEIWYSPVNLTTIRAGSSPQEGTTQRLMISNWNWLLTNI